MFKIGDKVRVITNPKGILWEKGTIEKVLKKEKLALINYGLKSFPILDIREPWKRFEELELINEIERG